MQATSTKLVSVTLTLPDVLENTRLRPDQIRSELGGAFYGGGD